MITFQYTAKNNQGGTTHGLVEAETEGAAAKLLLSKGLTPIDIAIRQEGSKTLGRFTNRVSTKDRIVLTRQLATLLNAGLPLTQSLHTVSDQTDSKQLALILNKVIASVEGGITLSEALSKHPKVFNDVYIALVAAGETSGTLDQALERIADQQEKDADMISKVRGALVYPIIVTLVIMAVVVFLLTTVVPQIELLYKDFNKELPFLTSVMIGFANIIINYWWLILLTLVGCGYFLHRWFQTKAGTAVADRLKMKIPLFGDLFVKLYMARFSRTGQTLTSSGVQMLEMLRITARAVDNVHVASAISRAGEKVKGGKALSDSLKEEAVFLSLVPQMLRVGEQSGAVDKMMGKSATYYETELDNKIKTISTTIEPVLMVFLALVVGGIVLAILVPVYNLASESLG